MYGSTTPWFTPPRPSLSYKGEPHVSIMQDLCRHPKSEPLYPHRSRESYPWYVVSRGIEKSPREGVPGIENSRSMALGANNRRAVQGVRQHFPEDETASQRLPPGLCNGRTETTLCRRV